MPIAGDIQRSEADDPVTVVRPPVILCFSRWALAHQRDHCAVAVAGHLPGDAPRPRWLYAVAQLAAHERVREATRVKGRVTVRPVLPVDILGAYVMLPAVLS